MLQKRDPSLRGSRPVLGKKKLDVGGNKALVTVLGPKLSLACVTFGGLSVSSGSQFILPNR